MTRFAEFPPCGHPEWRRDGGIADDVASRLVTNDHAVTRDLALLFEDFDQTAQGQVRSSDGRGAVVPAADSTRIGHPHETCRQKRQTAVFVQDLPDIAPPRSLRVSPAEISANFAV